MKTHARSDSNLQISRRLDWRFLLPEPSLRRVAYCGPLQSSLAQALQHFSEELKVFATPDSANLKIHEAAFDLLVMAEPEVAHLERVAHWLAPHGHIYAEVQHAWDWRKQRRLQTMTRNTPAIAAWQIALAQLGFTEIRAYWHRPSFERAVQIIPMNDEAAMDFVFSRRSEDLMSQLKFATGRSLMKNAWLARWLQCVSVVARKTPHNGTI